VNSTVLQVVGVALSVAALNVLAAPVARPAVGRHDAELCVATSTAAASCGPAQADLRSDGSLIVRVDDVVYHMELHSSQVQVVLMHNAVVIDEFTVPYEWIGSSLEFNDDDRNSRYEVRFPSGSSSKR
jgi:hypothetical protein